MMFLSIIGCVMILMFIVMFFTVMDSNDRIKSIKMEVKESNYQHDRTIYKLDLIRRKMPDNTNHNPCADVSSRELHPECGTPYWFIPFKDRHTVSTVPLRCMWRGELADYERYSSGNVYRTERACKQAIQHRLQVHIERLDG